MTEYSSAPTAAVLDGLARRRWLIVSGKGGVGRTTVAALLAVELAARGRKVLVATTGHDDRLAWLLGLEALSDVPTEARENLWAQRVVPQTCVREYAGMILKTRRLANLVFGNRIVRRMLDAVPGLDDFAVLGKVWHEATRGDEYDTVIFDGPASGHLRLVLGVPRTIVESIARGPLVDEATKMVTSLRDPAVTGAVLVGLPERWPLTELAELSSALHGDIGVDVAALVINRQWPAALPELGTVPANATRSTRALFETIVDARERGVRQAEAVAAWLGELAPGGDAVHTTRPMITLPAIGRGFDADALAEISASFRAGGAS